MASTNTLANASRSSSLVVSTVAHRPVSEAVLGLDTDAEVILRADDSADARDLLDAGATYVSVLNVLAGDRLVETIQLIDEDEDAATQLKAEHLDALSLLERDGLTSRYDRW